MTIPSPFAPLSGPAPTRPTKSALAAYAQKQAELKQVQTPPQADDFSKAEADHLARRPAQALSRRKGLDRSRRARQRHLPHRSGSERQRSSEIQYSTAAFHARVTTTWIVSSEGAIVRKSSSSYSESFGVGTQADDGMRLDRSYGTSGVSLERSRQPGGVQEARRHADLVARAICARHRWSKRSITDRCCLSADASADTLHSLLATGVTATRPKLGTEARTNGPFASSYHARILPDFLTVIDDPALKTWEGKDLVGSYTVDDEAVPAQTVKLVSDGHLENYLIGRTPVRDFPESNGHARAGVTGPAHPVIGVMKVTAQQGLSDDELNRKADRDRQRSRPQERLLRRDAGRGSNTAPALSHRPRWQAHTGSRSGARRSRSARTALRRRSRRQESLGCQLRDRGSRDRPGARAAVRRRHRQARQRDQRQAAVLSAAGVRASGSVVSLSTSSATDRDQLSMLFSPIASICVTCSDNYRIRFYLSYCGCRDSLQPHLSIIIRLRTQVLLPSPA